VKTRTTNAKKTSTINNSNKREDKKIQNNSYTDILLKVDRLKLDKDYTSNRNIRVKGECIGIKGRIIIVIIKDNILV